MTRELRDRDHCRLRLSISCLGSWLLVKEVILLCVRIHDLLKVLIGRLVPLNTSLAAKCISVSELAERSLVFDFLLSV